MIADLVQAISNELTALFTGYTIYVDYVPESFQKPSFLISLVNQDYRKRLNTKYQSLLSFDVAYFSNSSASEIKADCREKQLAVLRAFDLLGTYRVMNKKAQLTDDVLHITFDVSYLEMKTEDFTAMQQQETNTII